MAKNNFFAICWGRRTGVFGPWDVAKEHIHKYPDANFKGFTTKQEALAFYHANYAKVQADTKAKRGEKYAAMRSKRKCNQGVKVDSEQHPTIDTSTYKSLKMSVLICHFGGKNSDTTITSDNGEVIAVPFTFGATGKRKLLEHCFSALQWAERLINQGSDLVDIWGVDIQAINILTDWAPTSRERSWLNASGKPFANRDVVEPMLTLFEALGDKVKLHSGEQPVDDGVPF